MSKTVADLLITQKKQQQEVTHEYMKKLCDIFLCLDRPGLSIRDHREGTESDNGGNFLEFCHLFARYDSSFQNACNHIRMVIGFFNIIESLYINYSKPSTHSKFLEALSEEIEEGKDKDDVTAMGILSSIKTPNFIVCMFTVDYVLSLMNVLSNYFQKEEATLGASARLAKSTLATFKEQRDKFDDVWILIEKFAEEHDLTLSAPKASKKRKPNTSHTLQDYVVEKTVGQTVTAVDGEALDKDYWCCHVYLAVFDSIMGLQLTITIPVSSAGAERNFSAMRRVKTWLRSTTGQERFSSLSLIHIEAALLKEIEVEPVVQEFTKKARKLDFQNQKIINELLKMYA
ncbi:hypothetical protein PR048_028960 [Dryococelus australis]|uniref:HAT C-terminal dimerisation domain-containing protein n=1 Tax=Dryococelus australis TaxID=614101 RepID=A0ABQ9GC09_9NEOP|nr:hypothetical protein PR048_028960 [Dryococelus australis]